MILQVHWLHDALKLLERRTNRNVSAVEEAVYARDLVWTLPEWEYGYRNLKNPSVVIVEANAVVIRPLTNTRTSRSVNCPLRYDRRAVYLGCIGDAYNIHNETGGGEQMGRAIRGEASNIRGTRDKESSEHRQGSRRD